MNRKKQTMSTKRTHRIFLRFNSIYGGTWSSRFVTQRMYDEAIQEWTQDLARYSDQEIELAIQACKQRYQLAPTLPQFLELVKNEHYRKKTPAAPAPKAQPGSKEVAMRAITQMRDVLSQYEESLDGEES